jgi:hypothetical protein
MAMRIGILIYTYNRTDDARINMEIIRNLWSKKDALKDTTIVHSYSGEQGWWPEKYLEDELLRLNNPGHFSGAELLLNEGVKCFADKYPDIEYVITLASDTWLIKPEYVQNLIATMQKESKFLATCTWYTAKRNNIWDCGMALDFNVFNRPWATKYGLFPVRFGEFMQKYGEIFVYQDKLVLLEHVFALRFRQAIERSEFVPSEDVLKQIAEKHIHRIAEREPVHFRKSLFRKRADRKMYWPDIGLLGHHDPAPKRTILKKIDTHIGEHADRLIKSSNLGYYNNGVRGVLA